MEPEKTAIAINHLIIINNDRYYGYKTAVSETKDDDLKSMFTWFSNQSKTFSQELKKLIPSPEMPAKEDQTNNLGKLYRLWMNFRSAITDHDRKAILSSCEFGEDAAKKTYDEIIGRSEDLPPEVLTIIRKQREELQKGHDSIKSLREVIE